MNLLGANRQHLVGESFLVGKPSPFPIIRSQQDSCYDLAAFETIEIGNKGSIKLHKWMLHKAVQQDLQWGHMQWVLGRRGWTHQTRFLGAICSSTLDLPAVLFSWLDARSIQQYKLCTWHQERSKSECLEFLAFHYKIHCLFSPSCYFRLLSDALFISWQNSNKSSPGSIPLTIILNIYDGCIPLLCLPVLRWHMGMLLPRKLPGAYPRIYGDKAPKRIWLHMNFWFPCLNTKFSVSSSHQNT